jgi:F-type H+-transporting ATPase subunit epsilon
MELSILTPGKTVFEGKVSSVKAPGNNGGLEILNDHAPLVTSLSAGNISIKTSDNQNLSFETSGGFLEVLSNKISILLETVED